WRVKLERRLGCEFRCCRATPTASPSPCSASIQIRQLTRGSQIPIAPAAPHYVPCARFPPLEAFGRRPAQSAAPSIICLVSRSGVFRIVSGAVRRLVGIEGGVVSGVFNLESPGVDAPGWRPRHEEAYHAA